MFEEIITSEIEGIRVQAWTPEIRRCLSLGRGSRTTSGDKASGRGMRRGERLAEQGGDRCVRASGSHDVPVRHRAPRCAPGANVLLKQ